MTIDISKLPSWVVNRVVQAQLRECTDADKERGRLELSGLLCQPVALAELAFFGAMNVSRSRCVVFMTYRGKPQPQTYALEIWRTDREEVAAEVKV